MKKIEIKNSHLVGNIYIPDLQDKKIPGIILVSGSDGGVPGENAIPLSFISNIVQHGFAVLALGYFGAKGLPCSLENIELEYFQKATEWFKTQDYIKNDSIGFIGQSRGGELALILGSLFPNTFKAIIAYTPCDMVCGSFPYPNRPAWCYQGKHLMPFIGGVSSSDPDLTELQDLETLRKQGLIPFHENTQDDPFIISDLFVLRNNLKNNNLAKIRVEKITCPLLLFSGGKDLIWPATIYCQNIINRLKKYNAINFFEHINYDNVGHGIFASRDGGIYHPVGKFWCRLGGEAEANKKASEKSLEKTVQFLEKYM